MPLNGIELGDSDSYNLDTLYASLRTWSQIVSVESAAGRSAALATLAAKSPPITPSASAPVLVYRQDTRAIELTEDGATWVVYPRSSTPAALSLASGWGGSVQWARTGGLVTVMVGAQWTQASRDVDVWSSVTIGTGLPAPSISSVPGAIAPQWGTVQSNSAQDAAIRWAFGVDATGALNIQARWAIQALAQNSWYSGTFSYLTTSA